MLGEITSTDLNWACFQTSIKLIILAQGCAEGRSGCSGKPFGDFQWIKDDSLLLDV